MLFALYKNKMAITVPLLRNVLRGYLAIALICSTTDYQQLHFYACNWLLSHMWPFARVNRPTLVSADNWQLQLPRRACAIRVARAASHHV